MAEREIAIEILKKYVYVLIQAGLPIEKAFLFGSYASGEQTKDSDIDIMLISKVFDNCEDDTKAKPWLYTTKVDARIEPYSVGTKKFETDEYSPIIATIKKYGIEIKF